MGLRTLEHNHFSGLVGGEGDGFVQQGLIGHHAVGLDPAGGGDNQFRMGILDAGGQLLGGKAAKHHRMHRAQTRTGQHGHQGFGDHGHIDQDGVALFNTLIADDGSQTRHLIAHLPIGQLAFGARDRAVINDGQLVAALSHMPVQRIIAGIDLCIGKPAAIDALTGIESTARRFDPVNGFGHIQPECFTIRHRCLIGLGITAAVCMGHCLALPLPDLLLL